MKYYIIENYNNSNFAITFNDPIADKDHSKGMENLLMVDKCYLTLEVSDILDFGIFESKRNCKDIAFYAYDYVIKYLKNNERSKMFWIISSTIYNKKFNMLEDTCAWEGWRFDIRISDPTYKNLVFIIQRRKFMPPFHDTFQVFHFVISEPCTREKFNINPKCIEIIELAANSIHSHTVNTSKEYLLFLKFKQESLLLDEENLLYYQNSLNIISPEVYQPCFKLLYLILTIIDSNCKDKQKIHPIRHLIELKIRFLNGSDYDFNIDL